MSNKAFFKWAFFIVLCLNALGVRCEEPVGTWTAHFAYLPSDKIVLAEDRIYCAQTSGLFVYHLSSGTLETKNKVEGLSDVGVSAIGYSETSQTVVVGYQNGNIDLICQGRRYNLSSIKQQTLYADKTVRHVYCEAQKAYLSCDFGLVIIDLVHRTLASTCLLGTDATPIPVYGTTCFQQRLYAATSEGIKSIWVEDVQIADYHAWTVPAVFTSSMLGAEKLASGSRGVLMVQPDRQWAFFDGASATFVASPLSQTSADVLQLSYRAPYYYIVTSEEIVVLNEQLEVTRQITSYREGSFAPRAVTGDASGKLWIADEKNGLMEWSATAEHPHVPNGPSQLFSGEMVMHGGVLYATGGGYDEEGEGYGKDGGVHLFSNHTWTSMTTGEIKDFSTIGISSANTQKWAVGAWGKGVFVYENGALKESYSEKNSPLKFLYSNQLCPGSVRYDVQGNLYVSQTYSEYPLVLQTVSGVWQTFAWPYNGSDGKLFFDQLGQGWMYARGQGLFVFDLGGTPQEDSDDHYIQFYPVSAYSDVIYTVNAMAQDQDGTIWVGTENGLVLYTNPETILQGVGLSGSHILVQGTDESDKVFPLLGSEPILSIAVDGANRKWIGTASSGVFLLSANGREEIQHFTAENSPLPQNRVTEICLSESTGEVFFNTPLGMVSYRSDATESKSDFSEMYAYPNPVRPDYTGNITITGLMNQADIRITDVAGRLVYQTKSVGGQVIWDGKTLQGRRPATGVYLIFCTNQDGSETRISKLLFVK